MEKGNWWIHKKETILHYILDNNYLINGEITNENL